MKKLLITAGPTHEPIDAVRYIGNRSSGQLGIALAEAAIAAGVETTLMLGPIQNDNCLPSHSQFNVERFRSTQDLQHLLAEHWPLHDTLIMAAAVADYSPVSFRFASETVESIINFDKDSGARKIKRTPQSVRDGDETTSTVADQLIVTLSPTPDLVATCAAMKQDDQRIIGFALEPADRLEEFARAKLARKGLDAIVANPLETMGSAMIDGVLLWPDGRAERAFESAIAKDLFAQWLVGKLI